MSKKSHPSRLAVLLAVTVLCVAGCAGGSGGSTSLPGGSGPSAPVGNGTNNAPATGASAACTNPEGQVVGAAGGTNAALLGAAICGMADIDPCSMLKTDDVQALFSVPLATPTTDHLGTCTWPLIDPSKGDGLSVFVNVGGDAQHALNSDIDLAKATPIGGIGDIAAWELLGDYFPHLGAAKGQATCELTIGGGNGQLSVHTTGSGVFAQIDPSAVPGFMQQFGNLCNEVFAGLGASASGPTPTFAQAATTPAPAGQTSVRIGNFYADQNLKPGPALDLYDTQHGQAATPILTGVPYGSFSAYVHPQANGGVTILYVLPAGEDPIANEADAKGIGGYQDDGSQVQQTFILASEGKSGSGCFGTGPICELDTSSVVENGDDANGGTGPVASPPPAGQAELLVSSHVVDDENLQGSYYFFVDGSCDPPVNGDAAQEPGLPYVFAASGGPSQAIFPVTAGTHQISVAEYRGSQLPTCDSLNPKQGQMSLDVTAGQQVLVYVYGTSLDDLHLAVGPIQPSAQ